MAASIMKGEDIFAFELIIKQIPNLFQYFMMLFIISSQGLTLKSLRNIILISVSITILLAIIQAPENYSSFSELIHRDGWLKSSPNNSIIIFSVLIAFFIGLMINIFAALLTNISIFIMILCISIPFFIYHSTKFNKNISKQFNIFVIRWIFILFICPFPVATASSKFLNSFLPSVKSSQSLFSFSSLYKISLALILFSAIQFCISYYVAIKSIEGSKRFSALKIIISKVIAKFGTRFYGSDLSRVNFSSSDLRNSDLRHTNLSETKWINSTGVDLNLVDEVSFLNDNKILKLLTRRDISDGDFSRKSLIGINLKEFDLRNIDFTGTDLSDANLAGANLFEAKLIDTRLERTNLEGATLTGAYIENWGATKTTRLDGVHSDYIYRRLPTKGRRDPSRMPPDGKGNFNSGEFQDFARSLIGTLDLYHSNNFDSRAVAIVLQELVDEYKGELSIVEFEHKDNGQVVVRVQTDQLMDQSLIGQKYYSKYEEVQKLMPLNVDKISGNLEYLESKIREAEKSEQNEKSMIKVVIRSGTAYVATSEKGDAKVIDKSRNIDNSNIINYAPGSFNLGDGDISGTVADVINQLPSSYDSGTEDIKKLLIQLQQAVEAESSLLLEDRENLLEQVKIFAESKNLDEKTKRKSVGNAKKIFDATLKTLPDSARLVESASKLLPIILKLLGLT